MGTRIKKRRSKLWFRVHVRGIQWSIYFGNLKDKEKQGECELEKLDDKGKCIYKKAKIVISWDLARSAVHSVLWHELGHANSDASGADHMLRKNFPNTDDEKRLEFEEDYMMSVNNCMYETALSAGWLRLPEVPDWFDQ